MIDKIDSMGLDLTKSLRGHVRIETRDRWTGRVADSQEKDNLVTNALAKIYRASRGANTQVWNWLTPIYSKGLGGLLLFDGTLTASADNIAFPGSAKLVGFAGQGSDVSNPMAGSFNASESVLGANSFTSVWDFGTSQANGTISSIARTHYQFPYRGIGGAGESSLVLFPNANMGPWSWGNPLAVLGYDVTNKYIYLALISQQTYNGTTYPTNKIYRAYCDFETQPLLNQYFVPDPDKWTEIVTVSASTDGTNNAYQFAYDPYSNNFYYGASGTTKKIYLIAMNGTRSTVTLPVNLQYAFVLVATEHYYWYSSGTAYVYRVEKANPANTTSVALNFTPGRLIALADDCIMSSGGYSTSDGVLVYADLSTVYFNLLSTWAGSTLAPNAGTATQRAPLLLDTIMAVGAGVSSAQLGYPSLFMGYLGTIANLDNPVTKSSSQTMKITYTLTEA